MSDNFKNLDCVPEKLTRFARATIVVATSAMFWRYFLLRPLAAKVLVKRFVFASWTASMRMQRFADHLQLAKSLGLPVLPSDPTDVVYTMEAKGECYRLTIDQPKWLWQEGPLCFSLWQANDRVFSLCFLLSREKGQLLAYIGGIQGRREDNILDRYRAITKIVHGSRPRDFLVECFRIFCRALGVVEIRAVALANHYANGEVDRPNLPYDDIWRERGGRDMLRGYFSLSVNSIRRPVQQIPSRKRALYQRRYALFEQIESHFNARQDNFSARLVENSIGKID